MIKISSIKEKKISVHLLYIYKKINIKNIKKIFLIEKY